MKTIFVQTTSATKSQGPFTITDPLGYPYKMNLSLSQLSSGVYIEVIDSVSALNVINNTYGCFNQNLTALPPATPTITLTLTVTIPAIFSSFTPTPTPTPTATPTAT